MNRKVLVIAPKPNNETLGCWGTLLKHRDNGDLLYWLIVTKESDIKKWGEDKIRKRELEIKKVREAYNFKEVINFGIEATQVHEYPFQELVELFDNALKSIEPNTIYVHFHTDIHSDQRLSFEAFFSSCKPFKHPYIKEIFIYETLSETNFSPPLNKNLFIPNHYVDITEYLSKKIEIMKIYESEIKSHPFPRSEDSIRALAILRGSEANVMYAEAFMILRSIWK